MNISELIFQLKSSLDENKLDDCQKIIDDLKSIRPIILMKMLKNQVLFINRPVRRGRKSGQNPS